MNFAHVPTKELITGTSGSGKTTLLLKRVRESKARYRFIYDQEGQLAARLGCRPAFTVEDLNRQILSGVCLFNPSRMFDDTDQGFDFFCDYTFELSGRLKGPKLFVSDEIQDHIETTTCPVYIRRIMQKGRWRELDVAAISQQPNEIHNKVRNQFNVVTTFQQCDDCAVVYLKKAGIDPAEVFALLPGQYISRNRKTGVIVRGEVFKAKAVTHQATK